MKSRIRTKNKTVHSEFILMACKCIEENVALIFVDKFSNTEITFEINREESEKIVKEINRYH